MANSGREMDLQSSATFKYECFLQAKHEAKWADERKAKYEADRRAKELPPTSAREVLSGSGLLSMGLSMGSSGFKGLQPGVLTPRAAKSAAERFLDQKTGLTKPPREKPDQADATDVLCFGVSKEGCGRAAYLKVRKALPPQSKFPQKVTSSHDIGWLTPETSFARGSTFARKPIVQNTFFRTNGVLNTKDLNPDPV